VEIEKEEKGARSRISLYIEKEKIKQIDDMRFLMSLNGGNMDSIPEFTDMIDALIVFSFALSYPNINEYFLRQFTSERSNTPNDISMEEGVNPIFDAIMGEAEAPKYEIPVGYTARMYSLRDQYRNLMDKLIIKISETIGQTIDYSTFIKKSIDFLLDYSLFARVKWRYFKYIYIGNLYNLSPATSIKFAMLHEDVLKEITPVEMKQIKLLNSDSKLVTELMKILINAEGQGNKEQFDFLIDKFENQKNSLKSILWNFNYVDAFFGYLYSLMYFRSPFKNIISFIEEISLYSEISHLLSKPVEHVIRDTEKGETKKKKDTLIILVLEEFIKDITRFYAIANLSLKYNISDIEDFKKFFGELKSVETKFELIFKI